MEDQYSKLQRDKEDHEIEIKNLKKSLSMKDEMLDKIKGDVAMKDKLDKQIAELKKSLEEEKVKVKNLEKQLATQKE